MQTAKLLMVAAVAVLGASLSLSGLALAQTDQANTATTAKSHKQSMQHRMGMSHKASHKGKLYGSSRLPSKSQPQGSGTRY
jgi:hypothetical protein